MKVVEVLPLVETLIKHCSLWSVKLATLFSVTGGFGSAIHIEHVDFVPDLGW